MDVVPPPPLLEILILQVSECPVAQREVVFGGPQAELDLSAGYSPVVPKRHYVNERGLQCQLTDISGSD